MNATLSSLYQANAHPDTIAQADRDCVLFANRCLVQRELLHAIVNKTLVSLLIEQEKVLSLLEFPKFDGKVLSLLNNCIINAQSQITSTAVSKPMNTFDYSIELNQSITQQSKLVCVLLSIRLTGLPNSNTTILSLDLKRSSSVESDRSGDWMNEDGSNTPNRRRRRRKITNDTTSQSTPAGWPFLNAPKPTQLNQSTTVRQKTNIQAFKVPDVSTLMATNTQQTQNLNQTQKQQLYQLKNMMQQFKKT